MNPFAAPCSSDTVSAGEYAGESSPLSERMKYFGLVFRNLARNKRRSILTTLSITVSVFIFASLISLPSLLDQVLRESRQLAACDHA